MAVIIEFVNRNGQVLRSESFDKDSILLGRGYHCDLILADPHVEAEHLLVQHNSTSGAFICEDRRTTNGTWAILGRPGWFQPRSKRISGPAHTFSGQIYRLGRTYLRLVSPAHHVPPALPISRWEGVGEILSRGWLCALLALMLVALRTVDAYLSAPQAGNLVQYSLNAVNMLFMAVFYGVFWTVVGKNFGQDAKFATQFSIALLGLLLVSAFEFTLPFWLYNFNIWHFGRYLTELFAALTLFAAIYTTLVYVSRLRPTGRVVMASIVPVVLLIPVALEAVSRADFDPVPDYNRALVAPGWQMRPVVSTAEFLRDARELAPDQPKNEEESTDEPVL